MLVFKECITGVYAGIYLSVFFEYYFNKFINNNNIYSSYINKSINSVALWFGLPLNERSVACDWIH